MELRETFRVVRRNFLVILLVMVAALAAGAAVVRWGAPTYEAESTVMFTPTTSGGSSADLVQGNNLVAQRMPTYVDLATTDRVLGPVIADLALPTTVADLAETVEAVAVEKGALIDITVTGGSAIEAAAVANAVAAQLVAEAGKSGVVDETGQVLGIEAAVVQPAVVPAVPSSPNLMITMAVSVAVGLAAAFVVVVMREALNSRVRNARDLRKAVPETSVTIVPIDRSRGRAGSGVDGSQAASPFTESFRLLRAGLRSAAHDVPTPVLVVCSPGAGAGTSTVAVNLAMAFAAGGVDVTLVDADLRRPGVAELVDATSDAALADFLRGTVTDLKPARVENAERLKAVTTTAVEGEVSDLLSTSRMGEALALLGDDTSLVIVDAGQVGPVADALSLAPWATGYLVVVRAGRTSIADVRRAVDSITRAGGTVTGAILNRAARRGPESGE